jgi:hypothetical protein
VKRYGLASADDRPDHLVRTIAEELITSGGAVLWYHDESGLRRWI